MFFRIFVSSSIHPLSTEITSRYDSSQFCENHLQRFIHVYANIQQIIETAQKALEKLSQTSDGQTVASQALCQMFGQYMRVLSSSLPSSALEELRRFKSDFKDRLGAFEAEHLRRAKEVTSLHQALDKTEQAFRKGQSDIKHMHAKVIDPTHNESSFPWSPVRANDKDRQFERIQKGVNDQARLASDAEFTFNQLVSMHMSAYSRGTSMVGELASLRRKANRCILKTCQAIPPSISVELENAVRESIPRIQKQLEHETCTLGDFGMQLASIEASLASLAGPDREDKIKEMKSADNSGVIEYRAVQSYLAKQQGELSFSRNERVEVARKEPSGWWFGRNSRGESGYFPAVLISQRPAGAALPVPKSPALSYRPQLSQTHASGTWRSVQSSDDRAAVINQSPPFTFSGVVEFGYVGDGVVVESGEIVEIERMESDRSVIIRTEQGQIGSVPLKILTLKKRSETNNQENLSGLINWSSFP